ncbi:MAG: hypothetical protein ACRDQX_04990, partial [Pseudonocardiaceae bacterium]
MGRERPVRGAGRARGPGPPRAGAFVVPSEPAIRRTAQSRAGDQFDAVLGAWLSSTLPIDEVLTVGGKTPRGAKTGEGRAVHVLAAMLAGTHTVVSQREIPQKTNEITAFAPLLEGLDLTGVWSARTRYAYVGLTRLMRTCGLCRRAVQGRCWRRRSA